ncbi:RNA-guided endonuclease InsQ/TnpB family protein [Lyngbya aestuarii]|uniref:RNA-guided endonuclease InsQ/TnpB family protein n=1 Tax=Lyngbya aestuarii TaxID=118322 RepID=UPI0026D09C27
MTVGHENLNIKGLARTQLAKSIHDAAWGAFLEILQAVAVKRGLIVEKVDPRRTSIECFNCGVRVEKNLADRVHNCSSCGVSIDRDWNSGLNILNRALMAVGLPLNGCGKSIIDIEEQQVSFVSLKKPTS